MHLVEPVLIVGMLILACGDSPTEPDPDTTRPVVTLTNPASGAVQVARDVLISATFSETMDNSTITSASFTLNGTIPGEVTVSGTTATFDPDGLLDSAKFYTARLSTDITDAAGNHLATEYAWTFRTVLDSSSADLVPPTVAWLFPTTESIVGDTITVSVNATDDVAIERIDFYDNNFFVTSVTGPGPQYDLFLNLAGPEPGRYHNLHAIAYDPAGNADTTELVMIHHLWKEIVTDPNESWDRDISRVWARSTDSTIDFRIESNGNWGDNFGDETEGMDVAYYFDTDRSNLTGDVSTDVNGTPVSIGDIGADYRALFGNHGNLVSRWRDLGPFSGWQLVDSGSAVFPWGDVQPDTNVFELSIYRWALDFPTDSIDMVFANAFLPSASVDWVPNTGHVTIDLSIPNLIPPSAELLPKPILPAASRSQMDSPFQ